jgi:type IV secretory pathway TrbF-like protein
MQHKHDPSERDHRTYDRQADPRDPLSRAKVQLLMPLVLHRARIDHELRVGDDHLERGDASVRRAREQILDVIVRPPEPEERVRRVKHLVRRLWELRDLRGRVPT